MNIRNDEFEFEKAKNAAKIGNFKKMWMHLKKCINFNSYSRWPNLLKKE